MKRIFVLLLCTATIWACAHKEPTPEVASAPKGDVDWRKHGLNDSEGRFSELAGSMDAFAKLEEGANTQGRYYVHDA